MGAGRGSGHRRGEVVLRPRTATRVANLAPGLVVAASGVGALAEGGEWALWPAVLPVWSLAAVLMARAWRMEVVRGSGVVVVRGHLWTRRVPSGSITSVSDFPAIRWHARGSRRVTPLWMFWTTGRVLETYRRHAQREVQRLRRSLGVGTHEP